MPDALPIRCSTRALKRVARYAVTHGWNVERTRGGHVRFIKPGCPPVFTGFSPSDARAEKNVLARLRREQRHEGDEA
ncbi:MULTISPECIES: type II toxin-antitoxin system HicA family toxin [unclassified Salinicola]|jgi:predicted RNA binding protein YcfA (HicA-like mRNA interferase family)|uniref:type II toxin-antitoxin system HicA family toxin n=1 Tax=Salinicola sp. 4072 TaxID=3082157 RepID=UPI002FCA18E6